MKNSNLFFADVMRRHTLTEEQELTLQGWFFPGFKEEKPNKQLMDSTRDMMSAYTRWEAEQAAHSQKRDADKPLPPMTDTEIDAIAQMF